MLNFPSKPSLEREFKINEKDKKELKEVRLQLAVSFHRLFEMQGRANLLQTEFNRAFQPGSQTEVFFNIVNDNDSDLNTKIHGWNKQSQTPQKTNKQSLTEHSNQEAS